MCNALEEPLRVVHAFLLYRKKLLAKGANNYETRIGYQKIVQIQKVFVKEQGNKQKFKRKWVGLSWAD